MPFCVSPMPGSFMMSAPWFTRSAPLCGAGGAIQRKETIMAGDDLTPSEGAILMVLMVEAREVLNTELKERYGLDVRKEQRDKLARLHYVSSRRSGRTVAMQLD